MADREQFNGYTHQQIWDRVHEKISPDALGQIASHWSDHAQKVHDLFDEYAQGVKHEFAEWSGAFATSAQQSTDEFLAASLDAHGTATAVQRLMELNASAAQNVRASIPPPSPPYQPDPDPAREAADGGVRLRTYQSQAASAQADVQDTMNFVYNPTIPASGDAVPRFIPPPPGPGAQSGSATPGTPGTGAGGGLPTPGAGSGNTGIPGKDGDPGNAKPGDQPPGDSPQSNTAPDQTQPASTNSLTATTPSSFPGLPTGTGPATTTPTLPTSATPSIGTGSGVPSGSGTTGLGPMIPGTPGTRSPSGGGSGVSRPGEPAPTAAQANVARAARSAEMAAQRPMSSGMPHAGHGKKESDDDRSKASPEYLRRQYEELVELPAAGSGVIGTTPDDEQQPAAVVPSPTSASPAPEPPETRSGYLGRGPMEDGR
ncbi:hypothetical protein [Nocardia terpenica]|nr:hypothetical protein [Nocardia terpenica]